MPKVKSPTPYTGSPLGLITSFSEFNYGTSSNYQSLFSSYQKNGEKHVLKSYSGYNHTAVLSGTPHTNEVYDVSTSNIVSKLKDFEHLSLNFADFAYLKDFGVYPNNRLLVCRRFRQPVIDDLYSTDSSKVGSPISTVLGYHGESEDFIKLSFNEEWGEAEVSFVELLNSLGKDFGFNLGGGLGSILEGAVNVIPLPGATLLLQRQIMKELGIISNVDDAVIPQGDPNLIKEAKARTLISEDDKGSGLSCKVNIEIKTKYEQKFINGVDPTIVFMDILNNVLNMGTSVSTFYLGKQNDAESKMKTYMERFMKNPMDEIKKFIEAIINAFKIQLERLDNAMKSSKQEENNENGGSQVLEDITKLISNSVGEVKEYVSDFIRAKYKIKFIGIINSLTGGPSTPWHVTIGNPLRPIFCSGDMLCKGVDLSVGPQLSFNDLPTFIEVKINLESARNIGLQEIFGKFNTGGIRTTSGKTGEYITGISDSFWTQPINKTSSNISISKQESSNYADNIQKTDNKSGYTQSNITTVSEPSINESITPSENFDKEISSDPNSSDIITPAGSNSSSDNQRMDNLQNVNGSTDGKSSQQLKSDDKVPNSGKDANIIKDKEVVKNWNTGELVNSGNISYKNATYKYKVIKSSTMGLYNNEVYGDDGSSYTFQGNTPDSSISNMRNILDKINTI